MNYYEIACDCPTCHGPTTLTVIGMGQQAPRELSKLASTAVYGECSKCMATIEGDQLIDYLASLEIGEYYDR